jgi:hypothetical protein
MISVANPTTAIISNIIIGDNKLKNNSGTGIYINGTVYGVAHSNQFDRVGSVIRVFGLDQNSWANLSLQYGSGNNFYFEENSISFSSSMSGDPGWIETGQGGRIVVRYNSWNDANTSGGEYWDMHGLQTPPACEQYGTMVAEYYGNQRINNNSSYRWINQRGGWLFMFNNTVTGSGGTPSVEINEYSCDSCACCGLYTQHVNNSYYWNNTYNGSRVSCQVSSDACGSYKIMENRDFYNYDPSCTATSCSSGMGCGPSPPTGTCTIGVGYWLTTASPCFTPPSTMADLKTYTQSGTFYQCTAANTWTPSYTPSTYPHPLRGRTAAPGAPTGLRVVPP